MVEFIASLGVFMVIAVIVFIVLLDLIDKIRVKQPPSVSKAAVYS